MIDTGTEIIPRATVESICNSYTLAKKQITEGYTALVEAEQTIQGIGVGIDTKLDRGSSSSYGFSTIEGQYGGVDVDGKKLDDCIHRLKRHIWNQLISVSGIRSYMSKGAIDKLNKDMEKPGTIPEISPATIWGLFSSLGENQGAMFAELVKEVFDWVMPRGFSRDDYKTNQSSLYTLDYKVIKNCYESFNYNWTIHQHLQDLENCFRMLEGEGRAKQGDGVGIYDRIRAENIKERSTGSMVGPYFEIKWFKNGNVHIKITRDDLRQAINEIASDPSKIEGPAFGIYKDALKKRAKRDERKTA